MPHNNNDYYPDWKEDAEEVITVLEEEEVKVTKVLEDEAPLTDDYDWIGVQGQA